MSTNVAFKLQDAGFTRQQVEALGEFMDAQSASKADLEKTEYRLTAEIAAARAEAKLDATRLEERIERRATETESRLVKWVVGTGVAAVLAIGGLIVALMRQFPTVGH